MNITITKKKIKNSKSEKEFLMLIIISTISKTMPAKIEPRETYLVIQTVSIKIRRAIKKGMGARAMRTPADVATPFPPLKFRKTVKI